MRVLKIKVVIWLLVFNGFCLYCNAQRDSLRNIFPDNGLINMVDEFTDSLAIKEGYSFLSFVTVARYGRYGLLFWHNGQEYKSVWFFYRKNKLRIRPIKQKYFDSINVRQLLESKCDYRNIAASGQSGISQDYIMRIKTKNQEAYFFYSNYLNSSDSCANDLKYLMGWGF